MNQPKPEQNHHVVRNGRHDQVQFSAAEQKPLEAGHFQNLVYTLPKFRDTLSFLVLFKIRDTFIINMHEVPNMALTYLLVD